jgi:hypothetical protein
MSSKLDELDICYDSVTVVCIDDFQYKSRYDNIGIVCMYGWMGTIS